MAAKISKERTISSVFLVLIALATILPGGMVLALTLYIISNIAFVELTKACGIHQGEKYNALEITGLIAIAAYYLLIYFAETHRQKQVHYIENRGDYLPSVPKHYSQI